MNNINKELELLKKKIEELESKLKEQEKVEGNKRWRAKEGEEYWYVSAYGDAFSSEDDNTYQDSFIYKTRNYFKTKEEAEAHLENINTYYDLKDLAEELNEGQKIDWEDEGQKKNYIYFDSSKREICIGSCLYYKDEKKIYCLDKNFLDVAKERIGEEKLIKLFMEE